ncbi:hypothetical protein [Robertkochia flava]|uniref:hypothetical protein n=1 Tax=Robertkochia flava TaxID=3447986 RepID=UPI001CC97613|nr:hypothetical protein [Robertkochia marina]
MKNLLFSLIMILSLTGYAQQSLNEYKYVIVPLKYEFQKGVNEYRINTLVKTLLSEEGFEVYFDGQQPPAIKATPCKALTAEVVNASNLFTTKVILVLKDCYGNRIVETEEAISRIKDYEPSYHEAIRKAFEELSALEYAYQPGLEGAGMAAEGNAQDTANADLDVEMPVAAAAAIAAEVDNTEVAKPVIPSSDLENIPVLYAQPIENGFQLVDTTPSVRFKVRKTSRENTYAILGLDGVLYRNNGVWVAEYYKDGVLIKEEFQIKF